jgi:ATP-dependent DNA ligase
MEPMLAAIQPGLPEGDGWEYEPKWDGFRTIVHREGDRVELVSRGARSMTRYFPELVPAFRALKTERLVLDGELILIGRGGLDFDALQQRIHPADSRVRMLSEATPARYVAFDLLAEGDEDLRRLPLEERRARLEAALADPPDSIDITPYTRDPSLAREWFEVFEGAGLDGVIAKSWSQPYIPGKRGWLKVKHERTADCVVIGYRLSSDGGSLGSLLLGLYDSEGRLHYVGHTSSFGAAQRRELLARLEPMKEPARWDDMGRAPGGPSRWTRGRETEWVSIRPELVCEVAFDKLQSGERFRHASRFLRWRPDRTPESCGFEQIAPVTDFDVASILGR